MDPPLLALGDLELFTILDYLDIAGLTRVLQCSKRLLVLSEDLMARSPSMVSGVLPLEYSAIKRQLLSKMQSRPTMCLIFSTNGSNRRSASIEKAIAAILQSMPSGLALKYIANQSVQHGAQHYPNDSSSSSDDSAVVVLGAFPEAHMCSFMLSQHDFASHTDVDRMLRSVGMDDPCNDWSVFIVTISAAGSQAFAPEFIDMLQKRYPCASILGGITSSKMIGVGAGRVFLSSMGVALQQGSEGRGSKQPCISVMAMRGNVPLHTCVSRGVEKVSEVYDVPAADLSYYDRSSRSEVKDRRADIAIIGKLVGSESGISVSPLAALEATIRRTGGDGLMLGSRTIYRPPSNTSSSYSSGRLDDYSDEQNDGFDLVHMQDLDRFTADGRLVYPLEGDSQRGYESAPEQVQLFRFTPEACRVDTGRTLLLARDRFERCGHKVMGCLLFTCSGRGPEPDDGFFRETALDARTLLATFGASLPLGGYYASGEIGPVVQAGSGCASVLRRGRAAIQGFTAVFGLFALPRRRRESSLLMAGDQVSHVLAARRTL